MASVAALAAVRVVMMGILLRTAAARIWPSSVFGPLVVGVLMRRATCLFLMASMMLGRPSLILLIRVAGMPASMMALWVPPVAKRLKPSWLSFLAMGRMAGLSAWRMER